MQNSEDLPHRGEGLILFWISNREYVYTFSNIGKLLAEIFLQYFSSVSIQEKHQINECYLLIWKLKS